MFHTDTIRIGIITTPNVMFAFSRKIQIGVLIGELRLGFLLESSSSSLLMFSEKQDLIAVTTYCLY